MSGQSRQKYKNRANLYDDSPGYSDMNSFNPRSQTTLSQGHYNQDRDTRVVAERHRRPQPNIEELIYDYGVSDSMPTRMYKTITPFKPFKVYLDFSHCNASYSDDGNYKYDFSRSALRSSNSDKTIVTSNVIKMKAGFLKMPSYLTNPSLFYDMSELFVDFTNLTPSYANGTSRYHFKYYPSQTLSIADPTKNVYEPHIDKYNFTLPQITDEFVVQIRDKAGAIVIPPPLGTGIISSGNPTVITSANHGLFAGIYITNIKFTNGNLVPQILSRIYPITIIDANTFSIPINTTTLTYINNVLISFIIDNFNFEFNIKAVNINWDNDDTFGNRK
jgi:hypothetical protein